MLTFRVKVVGEGDGDGDGEGEGLGLVEGDGLGPGPGVGGGVTVIGREQVADWSPLVTVTVASNTPGERYVCAGFGLFEDPPSANDHENS
jgi:hypothetical protein